MNAFRTANEHFRQGRIVVAERIYADLARAQPECRLYSQALAACIRRRGAGRNSTESAFADPMAADSLEVILDARHPESQSDTTGHRVIRVVTPVFNGEIFIGKTIESVMSQSGDFFVDYVVKDAESRDGTLDIVTDWGRRLNGACNDSLQLRCRGLRMRVLRGKDRGLYDGLSQAFDLISPGMHDLCTYINADDVLHAGAFEIACRVCARVQGARWLIGQPNVINEYGETVQRSTFPVVYNRQDIMDCLHDGRSLNFIQQEGSFWMHSLYAEVGGFSRSLRLAGDFDLWRRFSQHAEPLTISKAMASFRSRPGQLSSAMDKYYKETDELYPGAAARVASLGVGETLPQSTVEMSSTFTFTSGMPFTRCTGQRSGALCFLSEDNHVQEIAYMKRSWLNY